MMSYLFWQTKTGVSFHQHQKCRASFAHLKTYFLTNKVVTNISMLKANTFYLEDGRATALQPATSY